MFPKGTYPLTSQQLEEEALRRKCPTVLTCSGEIAGYANLYDSAENACWLGNVIVSPAFRGRGAGTP
ncbi:GNAT family N-acetyltransferase [Paenibacillus lutrae]|uniref:GNAT family N-acetyltransferase n=1 Tax=Paenibacillus lutrae TaxID=2078573 RepID=UPI001F23CCCC|nr:GNAT family N-acetyltransferase [Paenibacillus lutrae]